MKQALSSLIVNILQDMGIPDPQVSVEVPDDSTHGDYTTNVAMKIWRSPQFRSPMDIALSVKDRLTYHVSRITKEHPHQKIRKPSHSLSPLLPLSPILSAIDRVEVAAPGFINIFLTEASLITQLQQVLKQKEAVRTGKTIMVEFAHPNTHKAFHIGHLRNITTGESIVRLLEAQGHHVIRANYQGDVGMHIAKCLYVLLSQPRRVSPFEAKQRIDFLGKAYAAGSKAFEEDPAAKDEIGEINKKIYAKDSSVWELHRQTRQWSLDYFEAIYKRVGSRFDRYYFESEVYESGKKLVLEGLKKGIFEENEGAIIFPGKRFGLHNRVFISGEGNATYEAKDIGLGRLQMDEFHPDQIVHVVGPEQVGYFQVVFEALAQMFHDTKGKEYHLIYGWVKLKHGKMSSRSGNVVLGEWLLDEAKKAIYTILEKSDSKSSSPISPLSPRLPLSPSQKDEIAEKAAIAAVKYAFLKVGTTSEIAFDIQTSVSFDGDSGPYLQYTYARARSVLRKAHIGSIGSIGSIGRISLNREERSVLRLIQWFPDVVAQAADSLSPSTLCTYLFKLAQAFNLFYAKHTILSPDHPNLPDSSSLRLCLTAATAQVLKNGLYLLGIETLEKM